MTGLRHPYEFEGASVSLITTLEDLIENICVLQSTCVSFCFENQHAKSFVLFAISLAHTIWTAWLYQLLTHKTCSFNWIAKSLSFVKVLWFTPLYNCFLT